MTRESTCDRGFREVMAHFPTGVVLITGVVDGRPMGLTVGSFASVSLVPRLVGFFIDQSSTSWPAIRSTGHFAVNVLAEDQATLCRSFAESGGDKFDDLGWATSASGLPILDGLVAWMECELDRDLVAGDHWLVLGRVTDLGVARGCGPLVFHRGEFPKLASYSRRNERLVERVVGTRLPTTFGEFEAVGYRSLTDERHHVALVKGEVAGQEDVPVRVHRECLTGDVFCSLRCDCGEQLASALDRIEREGRGVLVYLSKDGRGVGLLGELGARDCQDHGVAIAEANESGGLTSDPHDHRIGVQILTDLGVASAKILTDDPRQIKALEGLGLSVTRLAAGRAHLASSGEPGCGGGGARS